MKPFAVADDLDAVFGDCWTRLVRGVNDRRSPFHTPVVATASADGVHQRVMVLRDADRASATLRFHTDVRAAKMTQIGQGSAASVLGYDPATRIQLSLRGTIAPADAYATGRAWDRSALTSRRCYLAEPGPGTPVAAPYSGLPEAVLGRTPTADEAARGRDRFAVLRFTIGRIDWLELTAQGGNRRAQFVLDRAGGYAGSWVIP